jgi:hypothetical protein
MKDLISNLLKIEFEWETFKITIIMTKAVLNGKKTYLTKRTCHSFINDRPCELQTRIKTVFFELYGEFKVAQKAMPFVILHFETGNYASYDMTL